MNPLLKIALSLIGIAALCPSGVCHTVAPQHDSVIMRLYFRHGDALLLKDYRGNSLAIDRLTELLDKDSIEKISVVSITGSASPDGNAWENEALALDRARAVESYIHWKAPWFAHDLIRVAADTDFGAGWLCAVEQDTLVPRRDRVLEILRSDASAATKWANVQLLANNPARYIQRNIFPLLRNSVSCVVLFKHPDSGQQVAESVAESAVCSPEALAHPETIGVSGSESTVSEPCGKDYSQASVGVIPVSERASRPLFALKTNLLFDAATMLNLELEIPIGQRFSIAGEWIFPWWLWEKKQHCLQMMSGNVEGKYWFGNRARRPQMTGWFAGLYAGGGYYDLEWERTGYQGEFFIALGISGGYAHTINKSGTLRMEYSLGVGYMQTDYRKYEAKIGSDDAWHLYRRESGTYKWFGPTRAKISLVWMLNRTKKGGAK